jgi:hypothetical protein
VETPVPRARVPTAASTEVGREAKRAPEALVMVATAAPEGATAVSPAPAGVPVAGQERAVVRVTQEVPVARRAQVAWQVQVARPLVELRVQRVVAVERATVAPLASVVALERLPAALQGQVAMPVRG